MIDTTNRNTALAGALVEELARSGVREAVLSPGSRSTPVALALDREPGIRLRVVLDERAAGFLALGISLASGHPVAIACTSGSAAANLHPAAVEADLAGVPLVLLTSDRPAELRGIGAGQAIDQIKLYGDAVRWFCEVGTHDADDAGLLHYRATACRAIAEATANPGPVHLNLSWRDPLGPDSRPGDVTAADRLAVEGRAKDRPLTMPVAGRSPSEPLLEAVAEAVAGASRPLIVAGRCADPALAEPLAKLASRAGAPILAEPTSQLRFGGHDRSAVIAAYDLILREPPSDLDPDLVIRFGDMPTSKPLRSWLAREGSADQLVIDPPGRWNEPTRRARALISADAVAIAADVAERLARPVAAEWRDAWTGAERQAQEAIDAVLATQLELSEPAVARTMSELLADGDQLLLASSMPIRDAEAFMRGGPAQARIFANRGANGIDGLVSTAAGLATGGRSPTWALLGDLALAHDLGGLATLASDPQPVRIVLIDNGGGRIFEFLPQAGQVDRARFERLFITPSAIEPERVAALYGLGYLEIDSTEQLSSLEPEGDVLIHVRVDPDDNLELHDRLAGAVAERLAG